MKNHTRAPIHFTRREALRGVAGLAATSALGCSSSTGGRSDGAPRVAVIGGGAGGVFSAYFLSGVCDVTIFESQASIGGHCDTRTFDYQGQQVTLDVGAEFFHPDTHPIYVTLLEQLGLFNSANPGTNDQTLAAAGSLCVFQEGATVPTFASSSALSSLFNAIDFEVFASYARSQLQGNMSWDTTLSDWVSGIPGVLPAFQQMLLPWITSLIGTSNANAQGATARSILQTFVLAFPSNPLAGATTYNSKIGLQGNLQTVLSKSPKTNVQLNAPVQSLSYANGAWTVATPSGTSGPFDAIILNAQPPTGASLLSPMSWASDIVNILGTFSYFDSKIVIHTDPAYVMPDSTYWAAQNAEIEGVECDGSVWLGALQPSLADGSKVNIFKSWDNFRSVQPTQILAERTFQHPLITPATNQAVRALAGVQGRNGLYFAGTFATGMDSQESAIWSAMQVASRLAPPSPTLASLQAALEVASLTGISYIPT